MVVDMDAVSIHEAKTTYKLVREDGDWRLSDLGAAPT